MSALTASIGGNVPRSPPKGHSSDVCPKSRLYLQQPPQSGHRTEAVELVDRRDEFVCTVSAQDRGHQVERLGGNLVGSHWIARRAAHLVGAVAEGAAICRLNLHDRLTRWHR